MKLLVVLMLLVHFTASAGVRVGMKFDWHGKLVHPDDVLISYAFKHDKDGFKESAMRFLKESASYGNQRAKYFTGLLYLQRKDWANGYAWLKLVKPGVYDIERLRPKVESLMTPEEKNHAEVLHKQLASEYSDFAGFHKREAWRRKISITGSRIKGAKNIRGVTIETSSGAIVFGTQLQKMLDSYIYEYEYNPGNVKLGTLELIEEQKRESN